jgi:hypothetical protein
MTTTTQDAFHPMRGHVESGAVIRMHDGSYLTLRPASKPGQWRLERADGSVYADALDGAYAVTEAIVNY